MTLPDHSTRPAIQTTGHTPDQHHRDDQQLNPVADTSENTIATTPQPATVSVGDTVWVHLPYSEVCLHLRVAGTVRRVVVLERMAQILDEHGRPFSAPVLHGEAGIYTHHTGGLYTYPAAPPPRHTPARAHAVTDNAAGPQVAGRVLREGVHEDTGLCPPPNQDRLDEQEDR